MRFNYLFSPHAPQTLKGNRKPKQNLLEPLPCGPESVRLLVSQRDGGPIFWMKVAPPVDVLFHHKVQQFLEQSLVLRLWPSEKRLKVRPTRSVNSPIYLHGTTAQLSPFYALPPLKRDIFPSRAAPVCNRGFLSTPKPRISLQPVEADNGRYIV